MVFQRSLFDKRSADQILCMLVSERLTLHAAPAVVARRARTPSRKQRGLIDALTMGSEAKRRPGRGCEPSQACVSAVHAFALGGFGGARFGRGLIPSVGLGLKRLTPLLPRLLACAATGAAVHLADVGAGIHGMGQWTHVSKMQLPRHDDSDALWLLASFGERATVHAFEANPEKARELAQAARSRPRTAPHASRLRVHARGVGAASHEARLARCGGGGGNEFGVSTQPLRYGHCRAGAQLNVTSLDAYASEAAVPSFLYVKVDVEGGEWAVLDGMRGLLAQRRVEVVSFEYAGGWNPAFNAYDRLFTNHLLRADEPLNESVIDKWRRTVSPRVALGWNHTLGRFQVEVGRLGYDTYLIYADRAGVTLLPVHGAFWHPHLEICFNRKRFYGSGHHCWNDLLVVRRAQARRLARPDGPRRRGAGPAAPSPPAAARTCLQRLLFTNLTNTLLAERFGEACSDSCL